MPCRRRWFAVLLALALPATVGCRTRTETPPEVADRYRALVASLDPATPGASFAKLDAFAGQHANYTISDEVERERSQWRSRLDATYLTGRDLVREARFDEAEAVLKDLALAPNEKAGRMAREFLAFEFPQMKATRFLQRGDTEAAQGVLRRLTKTDLSEDQMAAAQRLLDSTSVVGTAVQMTRTTALKSAARTIEVFLHGAYAENGQYPASLTLDSADLASLRATGVLNVVGSLDDYHATPESFRSSSPGKTAASAFA